jgi:transposase InsO family protein
MADGVEKRYSAETLRYWLWRYNRFGLEGLRNKVRKDKGGTSVPDALQQALVQLREQNPWFTTARLLRQLMHGGQWDGRNPGRSALYRFAATHNLHRESQSGPLDCVQPFQYPFFGDLWSGDFMHGPKVRVGACRKKSYLHAIIDDATRYVVAATFHLAENTQAMLSDLMLAIRRFGVPRRFYTDNGAAFRSRHLRTVAARIRIALPHTPPYKPRGRGKIERFFRSTRDELVRGRAETSLQKLNADLHEWIATYHSTQHRILGMSPLNRKLIDQGPDLVQIDPTANFNDIFRMETQKLVHSDGCIHMWSTRFEARDCVPKEKVTVYYVPWDQSYILIGPDKLHVQAIDPIKNAHRFNQPRRGKNNNDTHEKE